jgi:hypothetical protein
MVASSRSRFSPDAKELMEIGDFSKSIDRVFYGVLDRFAFMGIQAEVRLLWLIATAFPCQ